MLQLKNITKDYTAGNETVHALKDISISFRQNEFVSILGPSGGGKTTLLNIIGGLDHYSRGDLIISGKSTKNFYSRDWDSYRNHSVGFVFQSYNLIAHQTVLSNVELALTLSGVGKSERKRRAKEALETVGLSDQLKKKPNQLSGGQMQRVAIARALVNDPEILLADEPTGALDTETSIQVMDTLKTVAKNRLVIMVTHNPELAEKYSTRIVRLTDGKIMDDSDSFDGVEEEKNTEKQKKTSMNFFTALSLSLNNLMTKRGRTFLTAFAGSIGIIGISLILSLSSGVNNYITDIQKSTMTSYPITIEEQSFDMSGMTDVPSSDETGEDNAKASHDLNSVYADPSALERMDSVSSSMSENNLSAFKKYLDNPDSDIRQYLGETGVIYSYNVAFDIYAHDTDGTLINTDGSGFSAEKSTSSPNTATSHMQANMSAASNMVYSGTFEELLAGPNDSLISQTITDQYDVLYGAMPQNYDELVLILNEKNEISSTALYQLGLLPSSEYKSILESIQNGETFDASNDSHNWSYEDICRQSFYLIPECDYYKKNDSNTFDFIKDKDQAAADQLEQAVELKVSGVIRAKEDASNAFLTGTVGYTSALTNYLIQYTNDSEVVKAQKDSPDVNVLNGMAFSPADDDAKRNDAKEYLKNMGISEKADFFKNTLSSQLMDDADAVAYMSETDLAYAMDSFLEDPDDSILLQIYDNYISGGSYDDNLSAFGVVDAEYPSSISIYADAFQAKDGITDCIETYNQSQEKENQIIYTDYVALLMSSITTIINVISYVLIAFVAVSLVVSSIMIGIITYISVLERTKEIGILRAIGASKKDISRVFNAETFIVGLCAGLLGVIVSALLCIPINSLIHSLVGTSTVNAVLPPVSAVILVLISIFLTLIAGLFPSSVAAKKDPVTALRSE